VLVGLLRFGEFADAPSTVRPQSPTRETCWVCAQRASGYRVPPDPLRKSVVKLRGLNSHTHGDAPTPAPTPVRRTLYDAG
jgi:hypothetical protein